MNQCNHFLVVGLGNPGNKYIKTRHNIGFRAIEAFAQKNEFADFRLDRKSQSLITEKHLHTKRVILAKPQTFMNDSGIAMKSLVARFTFSVSCMVTVHDDIDLPLGKIKIVKNRGSAGHKGVESIIKELKTKDLVRMRIGIKPISKLKFKTKNLDTFVLKKFARDEEIRITHALQKAVLTLEILLTQGIEKAMNVSNRENSELPFSHTLTSDARTLYL